MVAAALSVLLPSAGTAGSKGCPDGFLCLWTKPGYEGKRLLIKTRKLTNEVQTTDQFNDAISSLKLRKSGTAVLYPDIDGQGGARCFAQTSRNVPNLADPLWAFDDVISSSKIPKGAGPCPSVTIAAPGDTDQYPSGSSIQFVGSADDPQDGELSGASIVWTDTVDGQIGTGEMFNKILSDGQHRVTATATDSDGNTAADTIQILVQ